jgi:hypothetical protein
MPPADYAQREATEPARSTPMPPDLVAAWLYAGSFAPTSTINAMPEPMVVELAELGKTPPAARRPWSRRWGGIDPLANRQRDPLVK